MSVCVTKGGETEVKGRLHNDASDHFCQLMNIQSNTEDVSVEDGIKISSAGSLFIL